MTSAAPASFRGAVLRGLAWKSATRALFEATRFGVAIALARLLTPSQYGIAGMVLVIVAFEPVLSGVAVASALVRRRELTEDDRSTAFWTCVAVGFVSSAAGVALSWPVARFYGEPQVQPLFAVLSLSFALSSLGVTHAHLLVRQMSFRSLELRAMAGVVAGAGVAVGAAATGLGPWALVLQPPAALATSTALLWMLAGWRPRLRFSRRAFRELRGFGGDVSGMLFLFQVTQNADNVLVGRFLGARALGAYSLAYTVILVPFSRLASPLHDVLYPVFTRLQDDLPRLAAVWLRALRLLTAVAVPGMLVLVVAAADVVAVVFGERWAAAAPVMQILAWVGALYVVQGLNSVLLQALGRTRLLLRFALLSCVAGLGSFAVGLHWGIVGVAAGFAAVMTVLGPLYMTLTARAAGVRGRDVAAALSTVAAAALAAAVAAVSCRALLVHAGVAPPLRLAAVAVAAAAVYALLARALLFELRALVRRT